MKTNPAPAILETPIFVLTLDAELICRELSGTWRARMELLPDREKAVPLAGLFDLNRSPDLVCQLENLIDRGGRLAAREVALVTKDGLVPATIFAWAIADSNSKNTGVLILGTPSNVDAHDSEELRQLKTQYQLILESVSDGIWGVDSEGEITFVNKAAIDILGWRLNDVLGRASHEVHHHSYEDGSPYPRQDCPIYASLQDGKEHHVDNEVFWKTNGKSVPVEYISSPILKDGKPDGAVIVFRDNSARKEIERQRRLAFEQLDKLRTAYQLILDAAGEGIYGLDNEGRITFCNAASTAILGWKGEDIIGQSGHERLHHSHADCSTYPGAECPIYAAIKDGEVHRVATEVFWHIDGSAIPVEYSSTPILQDGKPVGAVVVFRDVSDRKAIEAQRELAYEEIKELKEKLELERDYLRGEVNAVGNFGEIIGDSEALKRTLAQVEAVAQTPASVLILGESGVGKELIARAIHTRSDRADQPIVKVNCASIPNELFESEFFGHVKGAFTGAYQDRVGRLQLADGGTLFLDEVGEIPLSQQGKLLRALQENEFERVGDQKTIRVNVRVVAATNRKLEEEVKAGRFREDLFYRLSVFPIEVPALRDRISDIAPLAMNFLANACRELGRDEMKLSQSHISQLQRYSWPGNIRELKNIIDRAVISSTDKKLRLSLAQVSPTEKVQGAMEALLPVSPTYVSSVEFKELEKANIIAALHHANWKTWGEEGAAALLGIKPSTLAYQMKTLGIKKPSHAVAEL